MKIKDARIVLTGAAGGIGSALARRLAVQGARLTLVDFNEKALKTLAAELRDSGTETNALVADLSRPEALPGVVDDALASLNGIDVLINLAGILAFRPFKEESSHDTSTMFQVNVLTPMALTRLFLPYMQSQGQGLIVNVGSIFGSIGFAWFTTYSATKAALQKFSEALRRELAGTGVNVGYVAPRAVRTPLNTAAIYRMAKKVRMNLDEPDWVAEQIVNCIAKDRKDAYLGFPESWFVRLNGLAPRLIDRALRKQNRVAAEYAQQPLD